MPSLPSRPTLRDVARDSGVSHMTVSRVVRGEESVAQATRQKVQRAIRKLGYRPDPALSALAAYRSPGSGHGSVITFLECEDTAYSQAIREGARSEAELLGYGLQSVRLAETAKAPRALARTLYHRGIRGLLIGPGDSERNLTDWDWSFFTAVSLSALTHQPTMNSVCMDYFDAAYRAIHHLRMHHCLRPAIVISPALESRTGHRWKGGFLAAGGLGEAIYESNDYGRPLALWLKRRKIDAVVTIHKAVGHQASRQHLPAIFLNADDLPPNVTHFTLAPDRIGVEGLRMLHHQLLRGSSAGQSLGKTTALKGTLQEAIGDPALT